MSDRRHHELERAWRTSGAVEDEATYLRDRVRVGTLTRARLRAIALTGDPAAIAASDSEPPSSFDAWLLALGTLDRPLFADLAWALAAKLSPDGATDPRYQDAFARWRATPHSEASFHAGTISGLASISGHTGFELGLSALSFVGQRVPNADGLQLVADLLAERFPEGDALAWSKRTLASLL
ncbi:MAG: hypothetical protein R3F62_04380 [Planctomycetota bacterium]